MGSHFERATLLRSLGKSELAVAEYRLAIAGDPHDGVIRAKYALCLLDMDRMDEARIIAEEAIRIEPTEAEPHAVMCRVLGHCGESNAALLAAKEAVRLCPVQPVYHAYLAIAFINTQSYEDSIAAADAALGLDPTQFDALRAKAISLHRLGQFQDSSLVVEYALEAYPVSSELFRIRGRNLLSHGRPTAALEDFVEARRLAPCEPWESQLAHKALLQKSAIYGALMRMQTKWFALRPVDRITRVVLSCFCYVLLLCLTVNDPLRWILLFVVVWGLFVVTYLVLYVETVLSPLARFEHERLFGRRRISLAIDCARSAFHALAIGFGWAVAISTLGMIIVLIIAGVIQFLP